MKRAGIEAQFDLTEGLPPHGRVGDGYRLRKVVAWVPPQDGAMQVAYVLERKVS